MLAPHPGARDRVPTEPTADPTAQRVAGVVVGQEERAHVPDDATAAAQDAETALAEK